MCVIFLQPLFIHYDVIKWKHFPRYWPFVRGIHRPPVNSTHKGQWRGAWMFSLICALNKQLSKQSWGWWFETPTRSLWRHCNVSLVFTVWRQPAEENTRSQLLWHSILHFHPRTDHRWQTAGSELSLWTTTTRREKIRATLVRRELLSPWMFTDISKWKKSSVILCKNSHLSWPLNLGIIYRSCESTFKCEVNEMAFDQEGEIRHVRVLLERLLHCRLCEKVFLRKSDLKLHSRINTGQNPSNKRSRKSQVHVNTGERRFQCHLCNQKCATNCELEIHLRVHTGVKPFHRHLCDKKFSQKGTLKTHLRVHIGEKAFQCHLCNISFGHQSNLNKHLRKHTGEKPFHCQVCDKRFRETSYLKQHSLIHTDKKPHKCHVCKMSFRHKSHLTVHLRNHTGERPYKCSVCNKTFTRYGTHQTHRSASPHRRKAILVPFVRQEIRKKHAT